MKKLKELFFGGIRLGMKITGFSEQFVLFLVMGGINTVFYYALYSLLIYAGLHYAVAVGIATVCGVLFNFQTFGRVVFKDFQRRLLGRFIGVYGILTDGRPVAPIARSPPYCRNTAHVCISGDAQHADLRIPEPFDNVPAPTGCVMQDIIMHEAHDVAGASLHTFVVCLEYVVGMRTVVDYNQLIFTADCLVYVLLQLVRDVSCPAANNH